MREEGGREGGREGGMERERERGREGEREREVGVAVELPARWGRGGAKNMYVAIRP